MNKVVSQQGRKARHGGDVLRAPGVATTRRGFGMRCGHRSEWICGSHQGGEGEVHRWGRCWLMVCKRGGRSAGVAPWRRDLAHGDLGAVKNPGSG